MFSYVSFKLLILMALLATILAQDVESEQRVRCGKELTNVLKVLCNGRFQDMYKRAEVVPKNSVDFEMTESNAYDIDDIFGSGGLFRTQRSTDNRFRFIFQQGIIKQCCLNTCSVNSLLRYCKQ